MYNRYSKYGNTPRLCRQSIIHQSSLEAKRCNELHILQAGGLISELQAHPQPVIRLDVNGHHVCNYLADFRYLDENGKEVYEDTKGVRTAEWILKKKLAKAIHGIEIVEVRR